MTRAPDTHPASRVVHASRLLDAAILSCLRSAFETPLEDDMTDLLVTLNTDDHLELLGGVLLNGWPRDHPTHLAFEAWRASIESGRSERHALLTAIDGDEPTPEQRAALSRDLERLASHRAEAMIWTARLGNARYPSVAAHLRTLANVDASREHVDLGHMLLPGGR